MSLARRNQLSSAVAAAVAASPGAILYGSFSNDTFHFCKASGTSLSDVDVVLPGAPSAQRACTALLIQERIWRQTGRRMPVSVRSIRIHDHRIPKEVAPVIGFFELLAKNPKARAGEHREYLFAKFLLRALAPVRYFSEPDGGHEVHTLLAAAEYDVLMHIKRSSTLRDHVPWQRMIDRITDRSLRRAAHDLWICAPISSRDLLDEFSTSFGGEIQAVYFDLCMKLSARECVRA